MLFDHAGASGTVLAWELENEAKRAQGACAFEFVVTMDALKDRNSGQARRRVTGLTPRFDEV